MAKPRYRCSKCAMGVIVLPKGDETHIIRGCTCDAPISADMSATVVACGGVQQTARKSTLTSGPSSGEKA